ncbi:unnamed protein product [Lactuca saligna]|uniref:Uncharacterized protein n=1 Tax=Lactuca saligna TaxID=75948 RepID=A0AA35W1I1_LACSI|nr:unnamed protein product [Lactuca saligna]
MHKIKTKLFQFHDKRKSKLWLGPPLRCYQRPRDTERNLNLITTMPREAGNEHHLFYLSMKLHFVHHCFGLIHCRSSNFHKPATNKETERFFSTSSTSQGGEWNLVSRSSTSSSSFCCTFRSLRFNSILKISLKP